MILACQRPDAKYLGDGIRDQFNFRVALGRMSELGYSMMFGEVKKEFFFKNVKGRLCGYGKRRHYRVLHAHCPQRDMTFCGEIGSLAAGRQFSPVMKVDESTMDNDDTEGRVFR